MSHDPATTHDSVSTIYAEALYELAVEQGQLDVITDEATQLAELLDREPDLHRLLASRVISTADRHGVIERLFFRSLSQRVLSISPSGRHQGPFGDFAINTRSLCSIAG